MTEFINKVVLFYKQHNFIINLIDTDLEFKSIKELLDVTINIIDPFEHIYPADQSMRTLKEEIRHILQGLLFNCIPKSIIFRAIFDSNSNLNHLLRRNSITKHASPLEITTNAPKIDCDILTL